MQSKNSTTSSDHEGSPPVKALRRWEGERLPPDEWGPDHFSMLVYLETRIVDCRGTVRSEHLRTKEGSPRRTTSPQQDRPLVPPTILAGGEVLLRHDDWDCIDDMVHAGMVRMPAIGRYGLTEAGWATATRLRRHLAETRGTGECPYEGFCMVEPSTYLTEYDDLIEVLSPTVENDADAILTARRQTLAVALGQRPRSPALQRVLFQRAGHLTLELLHNHKDPLHTEAHRKSAVISFSSAGDYIQARELALKWGMTPEEYPEVHRILEKGRLAYDRLSHDYHRVSDHWLYERNRAALKYRKLLKEGNPIFLLRIFKDVLAGLGDMKGSRRAAQLLEICRPKCGNGEETPTEGPTDS